MQKFNFGLGEHYNNYYFFIREHKQSISVKPRIRARDVDLIHTREFINWFGEHVSTYTTKIFLLSNKHVCIDILYLNI